MSSPEYVLITRSKMKQGVGALDCLAIWYTFQYGKIKGKLIVIAVICPVLAVPCCPNEKGGI